MINSGLNKKINWVATARVDTLDEELVKIMKQSGCSLLAIGFESGSQESLDKMNKKTTVEQNLNAAKLCKKYGIRILGYFLVGFPWETKQHLEATRKHIFDINADYIEISVIVPYYKTPIYSQIYGDVKAENDDILGHDSYNNIVKNYSKLSNEELMKYKKDVVIKFYLRPSYILKRLLSVKSFAVLNNYIHYGCRMLKNVIFK